MTKTTTKAKADTKESAASAPLIVLGYDENHKPRAARFPATDAELVTKAAQLMDLKVYASGSPKTWPRLPRSCRRAGCTVTAAALCPTSGKACTARSSSTLAVEPQAAVGKDQDELPVATGLPRTWDDIAPGHLVLAQEALDYGWWEAIVSVAPATCSRCGFGTTRSCPSLFAIGPQSR